MDWVRCVGWVRWVGWVQRRRSGTQRHYCLSVEQRAGEILRYGDLRSRALHGRETMQELRGLVTANEVWQSACMPKGRSPRCDLYPLGHRDDEKVRHCEGAPATAAVCLYALATLACSGGHARTKLLAFFPHAPDAFSNFYFKTFNERDTGVD